MVDGVISQIRIIGKFLVIWNIEWFYYDRGQPNSMIKFKLFAWLIDQFNWLHSLKLTWHLNMDGWKTSFLLGMPIFMCYVSFREGTHDSWAVGSNTNQLFLHKNDINLIPLSTARARGIPCCKNHDLPAGAGLSKVACHIILDVNLKQEHASKGHKDLPGPWLYLVGGFNPFEKYWSTRENCPKFETTT